MKPGLRHFFDSMADFFAQPSGGERGLEGGLDRLLAAHPGWDSPPSRVALYGQFVRNHVRTTLEKLYPLLQASVGTEKWTALVTEFTATRPARHFEMNRMGEAFPAFVADVAAARGLPEFAPALARFEWADWAVFSSEEPVPERVERLTVNPTLMVLQHPYRLCAYASKPDRPSAPAPGEEMALVWRHPRLLTTWYQAADSQTLLVLKMAVEGLSASDVAAATGMAEDAVRQAVEECVRAGLVLAP
jgi:hypothetical protein